MKVGDRVFKRYSDNEAIAKGTIEGWYFKDHRSIAVVNWDNGDKTKVLESEIELLIEDTPDPDSVTISRSEFHDITMKVINANNLPNMDGFTLEVFQIVGLDICRRLEREIFGEKVDNG
jgi:hypothetical protein